MEEVNFHKSKTDKDWCYLFRVFNGETWVGVYSPIKKEFNWTSFTTKARLRNTDNNPLLTSIEMWQQNNLNMDLLDFLSQVGFNVGLIDGKI